MEEIATKSFATVEDIAKAWRPLTTSEEERARVLLVQASNYLRQVAFNNGKDLDAMIMADTEGVFKANVQTTVVAAVQRALATPDGMVPDATMWTQSATPYSESMSFSGVETGTVYFKKRELELLGLGSVSGKRSIGIVRGVR